MNPNAIEESFEDHERSVHLAATKIADAARRLISEAAARGEILQMGVAVERARLEIIEGTGQDPTEEGEGTGYLKYEAGKLVEVSETEFLKDVNDDKAEDFANENTVDGVFFANPQLRDFMSAAEQLIVEARERGESLGPAEALRIVKLSPDDPEALMRDARQLQHVYSKRGLHLEAAAALEMARGRAAKHK